MTHVRRGLLGVSALLLTLAVGTGAFAQAAPLAVSIRGADLKADGTTNLIVSVTGSAVTGTLTPANFAVTEAGQAIPAVTVRTLAQTNVQPVTVALVMDMSVTAGQAINEAKAAARAFVSGVPANVRIALISFSTTPTVRVPFTTDKARLLAAINALQAGGRTAFFDALVMAADLLRGVPGAQHNIVAMSDGENNASQRSISEAIEAVRSVEAPITAVGLQTTVLNTDRLQRLAAAVEGGRYIPVGQPAQLAAAFQQVAADIASQYVVSYVSDRQEPRDLDIAVAVQVGSVRAADTSTVLNTRTAEAVNGPQAGGPKPYKSRALIGAFASKTGYYVGIGAVFAAALLFLGILLYAPSRGKAAGVLQRGLRLYSRADRKKEKQRADRLPRWNRGRSSRRRAGRQGSSLRRVRTAFPDASRPRRMAACEPPSSWSCRSPERSPEP